MKCPICGEEFISIPLTEKKLINDLFGQSMYPYIYNSLLHDYSYCPKDFIGAGEYTKEEVEKLKDRKNDLQNTFLNKTLDQIDNHNWARIAELNGFTHEILGNLEMSANAYKHSADILDELCAKYIRLKSHSPIGSEKIKILNMPDFENLKSVMIYSQNLKRLALNHYLKQNNLSSLSSVIGLIDVLISLKQYPSAQAMFDNFYKNVKDNKNIEPLLNELKDKLSSLKKLDESNPNSKK